jgi:hypothetical protein
MRTVDFDTLNLHWLQPSRTRNLDSTCSPNKALQLTIFPLLRNGKTAAELCVGHMVEDPLDHYRKLVEIHAAMDHGDVIPSEKGTQRASNGKSRRKDA